MHSLGRPTQLFEQRAKEEVALLHWAEGGLHLHRVNAARQVAVLERERGIDALSWPLLQHLEQQVVCLRVVKGALRRLQLRVRTEQRGCL